MLAVDDIKRLLSDRRLDVVSKATQISRGTLAAIRDGKNKNPSYITLRRLSDYLTGSGTA